MDTMTFTKKFFILALALIFVSCKKEEATNNSGAQMQTFVVNISLYAKKINPNFLIIPQNGLELAFNGLDIENGQNVQYTGGVNGFGVEELFYNGGYAPDDYRIKMAENLVNQKPILVSEFIADEKEIPDAIKKNTEKGFLCFPRANNNYDYLHIPDTVINENANNITAVADAKNYLYLISTDNYATKQDFINAIAATNFDLVLIDLFFDGVALTSTEVNKLKTKANGGKRLVIAYMSVGSAENYRYYWQTDWKLGSPSWLAKPYDGFPDEFWVEYWNEEWKQIIYGNNNSYTKKIIDAGFNGAYLDNVEAYYFLYN